MRVPVRKMFSLLVSIGAAMAMLMSVTTPASGIETPVSAPSHPSANQPENWVDYVEYTLALSGTEYGSVDCFKAPDDHEVDVVFSTDLDFVADQDYVLVVVKAATGNQENWYVETGDTVSSTGQNAISHLILCTADPIPPTTTTAPPSTTTIPAGPTGDVEIDCVVNNDYRVTGFVTSGDEELRWGLGNIAPFVKLDGGKLAAGTTAEFDDVHTLEAGSTVFVREAGAGADWFDSKTVPEPCPIDPTGEISIKCFVDDLYDVVAEIDGGSVGVNWVIRIKGGGGIVDQGFVAAFDDETVFLEEKQFEEGLVLVLRAPQNGGKLDSVTVPASCFAPVSDSSIILVTGCDSDASGKVTNVGETTLYGNVYINDVIFFNEDVVIEPGQAAEFDTIPVSALKTADEIKIKVWGPEGYEAESVTTYPEPCPTTTTVPPTTTVVVETPTTVPTTTVPDTTTTAPDSDGTVTEAEVAEPVEQTPAFTG